jgi:hypothetical protein
VSRRILEIGLAAADFFCASNTLDDQDQSHMSSEIQEIRHTLMASFWTLDTAIYASRVWNSRLQYKSLSFWWIDAKKDVNSSVADDDERYNECEDRNDDEGEGEDNLKDDMKTNFSFSSVSSYSSLKCSARDILAMRLFHLFFKDLDVPHSSIRGGALAVAFFAALYGSSKSLEAVLVRHPEETLPWRLDLLSAVPETINPAEFYHLLPAVPSTIIAHHRFKHETGTSHNIHSVDAGNHSDLREFGTVGERAFLVRRG